MAQSHGIYIEVTLGLLVVGVTVCRKNAPYNAHFLTYLLHTTSRPQGIACFRRASAKLFELGRQPRRDHLHLLLLL